MASVYISWCQRQAKCQWCPQPIEAGTPEFIVDVYNKDEGGNRRFSSRRHFHPQCYLDQGMDYLKMNPYVPHGHRGRPTKEMTPEDKSKRTKLLMAKAALEQKRKMAKSDNPEYDLIIARIDSKIAALALEISDVGGIPNSWIQQMIEQG